MDFAPVPALAKIVLLVVGAVVAAVALRGTPARDRHDLWLLVIAGTVLLPLAGLLFPAYFFKVPATWVAITAPRTARGAVLIGLVWAAGAAVAALRLVPGLVALRRIRARATGLGRPDAAEALATAGRLAGVSRPVTLLVSAAVRVPATWGVRRPVVALPAAALHWSAERLRLVLLHELLHVRRRDVMVEILLEAVTVVFWFHPAVWLAAGRVRLERERTCDEAVIDTGARASDYCAHLVEIMRAAAHGSGIVVGAGMAAPSTLEYRVRALLDEPRAREDRGRGRGRGRGHLALRALVFVAGAAAIYGLGMLTPCLHP